MGRPRKFEESHVIAAACDAFRTGGYEGTSVDDLTAATGLGKGSLYAAFGGKRELFQRVYADHCAEGVEAIHARLDGPDDGAFERLRNYVFAECNAAGPSGDARGCFIAKTAAEVGSMDAVVGGMTATILDELAQTLSATIEAAQRAGDIAASSDPQKLGMLLLAVLRGIEALGKGGVSATMLERAADAAIEALPRTERATTATT